MEKKWQNVDKYKWKKAVTLTPAEGIQIEGIYQQFGCANITQFCKGIVRGTIQVSGDVKSSDNSEYIYCKKEYLQELEQYKETYNKIKFLMKN